MTDIHHTPPVPGGNPQGATLAALFALFPALALLLSVKGGFVGFTWVRQLKMKADHKSVTLFKTVFCVGRVGLDHDSRKAVIQARADGTLPSENQGLPWGQWLLAPWFITHKGGLYVRLYPVANSVPHVTYSVQRSDGTLQTISKEEARFMALASEFSEVNPDIGCMTLKAESLRSVRYGQQVTEVSANLVSVSV